MLSVIIPARNGRSLTSRCLSSVLYTFQSTGYPVEFILIDDESPQEDGILDVFNNFKQAFAKQTLSTVRIVQFKKHQHYTGVVACGLSLAQGDHVFLLSNDMMVTPDFIKSLLGVANLEPAFGIVRGTSQYTDSHPEHVVRAPLPVRGYPDVIEFSNFVARYFGLQYAEDQLLSGDAVLFKRSLLQRIGVMDTQFFGYFGDVDYGIRARRAGYKLVCAKGAWLHHDGAGHLKQQASPAGTAMMNSNNNSCHQERMRLVQSAYELFRYKWDNSLDPVYAGLAQIDFERLLRVHIEADEFQPPMLLDGNICNVF